MVSEIDKKAEGEGRAISRMNGYRSTAPRTDNTKVFTKRLSEVPRIVQTRKTRSKSCRQIVCKGISVELQNNETFWEAIKLMKMEL